MPDSHEHIHIDINAGTILKTVFIVLFFALLFILKDVLLIVLFALIITSGISPFANWLDEKKFPRIIGVLFLFLTLLGLMVFIVSLVIPVISQEINQLLVVLPDMFLKLSAFLETAQEGAPPYLDFVSEIQNMLEGMSAYLQQASQSVIGVVVSIFGGVLSFVAILIISFYLSVTRNGVESFIQAIMPQKYELYTMNLWKRAQTKVGHWIQGQILISLLVGLMVYIGLSILGVPYAFLLGLLAALFEIIPIAGPVLAAIPAVFLAFLDSPTLALWVILYYVVVQQLESYLLVPLILGKSVGLNPVVIIIAVLVGHRLAGIPGMLIAVPIATVIVEMLDDLARHKEHSRTDL